MPAVSSRRTACAAWPASTTPGSATSEGAAEADLPRELPETQQRAMAEHDTDAGLELERNHLK